MLQIDPTLFTEEAISAETRAFLTRIEATLAEYPATNEVPVELTRKAREEGKGLFPLDGPLEGSEWQDYPGGQRRGDLPGRLQQRVVPRRDRTNDTQGLAQHEVHDVIRATLAERFGTDVSDALRLLYGGSVKPDNAAEIFKVDNVDGALIGGASLTPADFVPILQALSAA